MPDAGVERTNEVIRANRQYYAERAAVYDSEEHCASHHVPRELLASVLSRALILGPDPREPTILDACGGSGNVSEVLLSFGYRTVLVDVSPEMLSIWRGKAETLGHQHAEVIESEVGSFLREDGRAWDIIVFSSAIHHLEKYDDVAADAVRRLVPGGVLVTIFDPTMQGRLGRTIRRLDWIIPELGRHPVSLVGKAARKMARALATAGRRGVRADVVPHTGALAERHAASGVDEERLIAAIEGAGAEVVVHERYSDTRLVMTELAFRAIGQPSSFHLIARKGSRG